MTKGRSPLKNPPLRNPGESLQNEFDKLMDDKALLYIMLLVWTPVLAVWEWIRYWTHQTPHPIAFSIIAIPAVIFSWIGLCRLRIRLRNISRGLEAEKSVGQYLEQFRAQGYQIFHDIPGESGGKKFNIDHVIIGPKGIFTIETKYARKPERGQTKISYDGKQIAINGRKVDPKRDPVVQAKAQSRDLCSLLKESTGKAFFVKPVVVYPGWYVPDLFNADVWVINPDRLGSFVKSHNVRLSDEDAHLASYHLSRHIQSTLK